MRPDVADSTIAVICLLAAAIVLAVIVYGLDRKNRHLRANGGTEAITLAAQGAPAANSAEAGAGVDDPHEEFFTVSSGR